jgi:hypothetical protein
MVDFIKNLPDYLNEFIDPSLPKELRLNAARGLITIPPKNLVKVLYNLTLDEDEEISKEAKASLKSIPDEVIGTVLDDTSTSPELLDYIARNTASEFQLQKIILNPSTNDTIAFLAETVHSSPIIELITDDQKRILRSEVIVEALTKNPSISRSKLDRVISIFKLYLAKKGEAPLNYPKYDSKNDPSEDVPEEAIDSDISSDDEEEKAKSTFLEDINESFLDGIDFSNDLTEETGEEIDEAVERRRESLFHKIKQMNIPQRIKLALLGNRAARAILVRDSNRMVAVSAIRNPGVTDMEIILIVQSKTANEEVLNQIASTRRWTRNYQVKVALVNNPKTPPPLALRFIRHLRDKELQALSKNKDVPGVIASSAMRLYQQKIQYKAGGSKH